MFTCTGKHDEFVASIPEDMDPDRIGIIIYADGTASDRWADGTVGVPPEAADMAAADEEPYCPVCDEYAKWEEQ